MIHKASFLVVLLMFSVLCPRRSWALVDFLEKVQSTSDFEVISSPVSLGEVEAVAKFLLPANAADSSLLGPVFQNTNKYQFHREFLATVFPDRFPDLSFEEYLNLVERRATRRYYAGSVARLASDTGIKYGFRLYTDPQQMSEMLTVEETRIVFETLRDVFLLEPLVYAPDTEEGRSEARGWKDPGFPVYLPGGQGELYIAYTHGETVGKITFLNQDQFVDANARGAFGWQDILILDHAPADIEGVIAGVITSKPQTELSHLSIRTSRRGTPNAYVAFGLEAFRQYDNKIVRLTVNATEYNTEVVSLDVAQEWWAMHRPTLSRAPSLDVDYTGIDSVTDIDMDDQRLEGRYGGKASNFAKLQGILVGGYDRYKAPAFAIPLHYYHEFMATNTTASFVDPAREVSYSEYLMELISVPKFKADSEFRYSELEKFQAIARDEGQVSSTLMEVLKAKIVDMFGDADRMVRFRSSSNLEDSLEFSGAGLYESTSACAADDFDDDIDGPSQCDSSNSKERSMSRALKKVWASLWLFRAYEEREYFQVNHALVGMGVLVTEAFLDEEANGVAFSGNPSNARDSRYVINVQIGENSVVSPDPDILAEKDLVEVKDGKLQQIIRVRGSSLVDTWILDEGTLNEFGLLLWYLSNEFPVRLDGHERNSVLLDVEFKIERGGTLAIKQIRPFLRNSEAVSPVFYLRVPGPTAACGAFRVARATEMEYKLKAMIQLKPGDLLLDPNLKEYHGELIDRVSYGSDLDLGVPIDEGTFRCQVSRQGDGNVVYYFSFEQQFLFAKHGRMRVDSTLMRFEAENGVPKQQMKILDEEAVLNDIELIGYPEELPQEYIRFSSCTYSNLPKWEIGVELSDRSKLILEERFLPSPSLRSGAASLQRATVRINDKQEMDIDDYWLLTYSAYFHNMNAQYWVVMNPPQRVDGLAEPIHIIEVNAGDDTAKPPVPKSVRYLSESLFVIAEPEVTRYEKVIVDSRERFVRGDVDYNGRLNLTDCIVLLRQLFQGGEPPSCRQAADSNDDGHVNLTDVIYSLSFLFRNGEAIPDPSSLCDTDKTPDDLDCLLAKCSKWEI